jgi:hypothetical protein
MVGTGSSTNVTTIGAGLYYIIQPTNSNLAFNQTYSFNFTVNSTENTFDSFGMYIKLQNGTIVNSTTSAAAAGGTLNRILNVTSNRYVTVYANWTIDGETAYTWKTYTISNLDGTDFSLAYLFTDLRAYVTDGMFGLDSFGLTIIIFLIIFTITGIMCYNFGIYSPVAITGIAAGLVGFFDVGLGMIDNPVSAITHFPTVFVGIIFIALLIKEASSY